MENHDGASAVPVVVLVEDDALHGQIYAGVIRNAHAPVRVVLAPNGFNGLVAISANDPVALITDIDVPDINGIEMIRIIRADPDHADLPIMAVSGMSKGDLLALGNLPENLNFMSKSAPDWELMSEFVRSAIRQHQPRKSPARKNTTAPGEVKDQ